MRADEEGAPQGPQERPWSTNAPALGVSPGGRRSGSTVVCLGGPRVRSEGSIFRRFVMFGALDDRAPVTLTISGSLRCAG